MAPRDPLANPEQQIRRVYAYVAYRIGDGADAEDVTSETMLRAVRYRDSYDSRCGTPIAWLIGIARRCIDDHHASVARQPTHGRDLEPADNGSEERVVERLTLTQALAKLGRRDQDLLALRYGADLPTKQIARLLETTPNNVDVGLHRARSRLRSELVDGGADGARPSQPPLSGTLRERPT